MAEHKAGDAVRVTTDDAEYEGILMPRPDILEKGIIVVKLRNGYNIGIEEKKIKKIEVAEKYEPKKEKKEKIPVNKKLPTVSVISTGGTISSRVDYRTGGVHADYTAEDFVQMMPELAKVANIRAKKIMSVMSEDMNPECWKDMAEQIATELNSDADGVVVTHGTDTMHFSTAAMSFFLKNISKPVVFTASQRSIDRGSSDAFMNLICAVNAAAKSGIAEVMTCMHGTSNDDYCLLIRGTKARKMHTSRRDAFRPINELPLAKVYPDGKIEEVNKAYKKRSSSRAEPDSRFEKKTAIIHVYPGMDPEIIKFYADRGYKGLVIAATALGHVPTAAKGYSLLENIEYATKKGIAVAIASQTVYGRVHPLVYTNLRKLSVQIGCIFAEDMLPETAYVKLGWALAHAKGISEVKELMQKNIAGEITERSDARSFLY